MKSNIELLGGGGGLYAVPVLHTTLKA